MTQTAKNILITLGFAISAIICITCFIPIITYITFPIFIVFLVLWAKHTTIGQRVYESFLESIGGNEEIEEFEYDEE